MSGLGAPTLVSALKVWRAHELEVSTSSSSPSSTSDAAAVTAEKEVQAWVEQYDPNAPNTACELCALAASMCHSRHYFLHASCFAVLRSYRDRFGTVVDDAEPVACPAPAVTAELIPQAALGILIMFATTSAHSGFLCCRSWECATSRADSYSLARFCADS